MAKAAGRQAVKSVLNSYRAGEGMIIRSLMAHTCTVDTSIPMTLYESFGLLQAMAE